MKKQIPNKHGTIQRLVAPLHNSLSIHRLEIKKIDALIHIHRTNNLGRGKPASSPWGEEEVAGRARGVCLAGGEAGSVGGWRWQSLVASGCKRIMLGFGTYIFFLQWAFVHATYRRRFCMGNRPGNICKRLIFMRPPPIYKRFSQLKDLSEKLVLAEISFTENRLQSVFQKERKPTPKLRFVVVII